MHPDRGMEVDIHHTLLPLTARVRLDPERLWEASIPTGRVPLRVLAPADMFLHSAAHLFADGEVNGGLRDLVDLHRMAERFGREPEFWPNLPQRAEVLGLSRPLHYALRYCRRLLDTPMPADVVARIGGRGAPSPATQALMDRLVEPVLGPRVPDEGAAAPGDLAALCALPLAANASRATRDAPGTQGMAAAARRRDDLTEGPWAWICQTDFTPVAQDLGLIPDANGPCRPETGPGRG